MARTTIALDDVVLAELKERAAREGKSLGQVASELLATSLKVTEDPPTGGEFRWISKRMVAKVDLEDKELLRRTMDEG